MANAIAHEHQTGADPTLPDESFFDDSGVLERAIALGIVLVSAAVFLAPTTVGLIFGYVANQTDEPGRIRYLFPLATMWVKFDLASAQELFFSLPVVLGVVFGRRVAVRRFAKWAMVLTLLYVAIGGTIALYTYPELDILQDVALTMNLDREQVVEPYTQIQAQIEGTRTASIAFIAALVGLVMSRARI